MIFVTGDLHGGMEKGKFHPILFPEQRLLVKDDYVIIAGDFGCIWDGSKEHDEVMLKWLEEKPFTTLFIDGNHENFDLLYKYPTEVWNGGVVHRIRDSILHLTRGQVFNIFGYKIFTFGGATSIDKAYRREGISWWPQEIPNHAEIETALDNLAKVDNKVDYVITHTCTSDVSDALNPYNHGCPVNKMLDEFDKIITYKKWYFGHMHVDQVMGKHVALYNDIRRIGAQDM